jgi:hypothetical protein
VHDGNAAWKTRCLSEETGVLLVDLPYLHLGSRSCTYIYIARPPNQACSASQHAVVFSVIPRHDEEPDKLRSR